MRLAAPQVDKDLSVMLAKLYGGDASLAASGVLATHLVAIITSPLILFLALS